MRVLIAEDDGAARHLLEMLLKRWGYEVQAVEDGSAAWAILVQPDAPRLVILDWMMPGLDGIELCRRLRRQDDERYTYVLLLTALDERKDVVEGFRSGADDFLNKPFDGPELRARVHAGERVVKALCRYEDKVTELRANVERTAKTSGLLTVCSSCRKVHDPEQGWLPAEHYLRSRTGAAVLQDRCPECREAMLSP